jgi:nitroreductase
MNPAIDTLIETRTSTTRYQAGRELPAAVIRQLVQLATRAPSAYNLQNWTFIAVHSAAAKARLHAQAYEQRQVLDPSVTFILCGTLAAHRGLAQALQPSLDAGILPQRTLDGWVATASETHAGNPQLQRDEALRSASLAAMTLMLAAQGMGLASGAMSGFDSAGVAGAFGLTADELPVMLVTVGYPDAGNWPQKMRKPLAEVLAFA